MARLIDADKLLECYEGLDNYHVPIGVVKANIDDMPTVDAVPVIRCRECKWIQNNMMPDGYLPKGVPELECRHWCGATDPTDFCSRGERKGGDG